jgi:hypothetical protein
MMGGILYLCWFLRWPDHKAIAYNYFVVIIGAILGWSLGMFFSPFSEKEGMTFATIGQTVSVFVSGYIFSKLDRFLEASMFDADKMPVEVVWWRAALLFASLVLMMLTVFSGRAYFSLEDPKKEKKDRYQQGKGG